MGRRNTYPVTTPLTQEVTDGPKDPKADILVAGSVAVDLSCDYAGNKKGDVSPQASTSNPASISQSIGGVGHNVALAAHRASASTKVKLCSLVGEDVYVILALEDAMICSIY